MWTRRVRNIDLPLLTATLAADANTGYNLGLLGSTEFILLSNGLKLFIPFQDRKKYSATLLLTLVLTQIRNLGMLHASHEGIVLCKVPQTHGHLIQVPPSPNIP